MTAYLVLLRGVNVGGKNPVPMAQLRKLLADLGYEGVATYIASGNVVLRSDRPAREVRAEIEEALPRTFRLHSERIAVLVLTHAQLRAVVDRKPDGFGEQPETFHSDVIFLIDIDAETAMQAFDPRPGVDTVWAGDGVIYSQRLSAKRTAAQQGDKQPRLPVDDHPQLGHDGRPARAAGALHGSLATPGTGRPPSLTGGTGTAPSAQVSPYQMSSTSRDPTA